jgi:hypothetical protein
MGPRTGRVGHRPGQAAIVMAVCAAWLAIAGPPARELGFGPGAARAADL